MGIRRNARFWLSKDQGYPVANDKNIKMLLDAYREATLYAEPLTLEELSDIYASLEEKTILNICRAIERAHGIAYDNYVDDRNRHYYEIQES